MSFLKQKDGTHLFYEVVGKGEPVLFLNGYLSSTYLWKKCIPDDFKERFKCIFFSYRGQEYTRFENEIDFDHLIEDAKKLVNHLDYKKVNLVGYGLGGRVALGFMKKYGKKVNKAVLSATTLDFDTALKMKISSWKKVLEKNDLDLLLSVVLPDAVSHNYLNNHQEKVDELKEILVKSKDRENLYSLFKGVSDQTMLADFSDLKSPILILQGMNDSIVPYRHGRSLHEKIPHSIYHEIDTGHILFQERPEKFFEKIADFLNN